MKLILLIAMSFIASLMFAQISVTTIPVGNVEKTAYDSLTNWPAPAALLVGQELFVPGMPAFRRNNGYEGLSAPGLKRYKCCQGAGSKYDSIVGKYFTVIDHKGPKTANDPAANLAKQELVLVEKTSGDTVYYSFMQELATGYNLPFVTVGYFNKLEQSHVGNTFYLKGKSWIGENTKVKDINSGVPLDIEPGSKWKCTGVTVENEYYLLSLILENETGKKVAYHVEQLNKPKYSLTQADVDYLTKKYGAAKTASAIKGKAVVGMTEELVKYTLGEPLKIDPQDDGSVNWYYYKGNGYQFNKGVLVLISN